MAASESQAQRTDSEVAHDLARVLAHEERRRKQLARVLTGVGAVVLLLVVLAGAGIAMRASASSAAPVSAQASTELSAPAEQPSKAAAAEASAPRPEPAASTAVVAPKKKAAPPNKTALKKTAAPKVTTSKYTAAAPIQAVSQQRFKIAIGGAGYEPASITAKEGSPITVTVGKGEGCAAGFNMPELGVRADNSSGPVSIKLGRPKRGSYTYTCFMGMVSGTLRVR